MAYSALGIMKLKTGDDAGAEKDLKTAAELDKVRPDPYIWYHLALAQDHRKKYAAALSSVSRRCSFPVPTPNYSGWLKSSMSGGGTGERAARWAADGRSEPNFMNPTSLLWNSALGHTFKRPGRRWSGAHQQPARA